MAAGSEDEGMEWKNPAAGMQKKKRKEQLGWGFDSELSPAAACNSPNEAGISRRGLAV